MKKRFFNLLTLTILISSTISFFGCKVDNEYNLDNIDATNLSVLPGVSIPVGSFKMITLGDILKLENQEFISVDNEGNSPTLITLEKSGLVPMSSLKQRHLGQV